MTKPSAVDGWHCPYPALPPPTDIPLVVLPEHPCVYLPGRMARMRAMLISSMPPEMYHGFMDAGFRRSGRMLYQPVCPGCRACMPIRIPVAEFRPDKSQRRCWRRNQDLRVTVAAPVATDEKHALYCRYLAARHDGCMEDDREAFEAFLYDSPVQSVECCYRDPHGRLLAVGICDISPQALSSVYFYFDPADSRRGLGTFGSLWEIDLARRIGIPHYYLGYWISGCRSMDYKALFRPHEILHPDGQWRRA